MLRPVFNRNPRIKSHHYGHLSRWARGLLILTTCWVLFPFGQAGAQINGDNNFYSEENIVVESGGKLWLEGKASIVDYRCDATSMEGIGTLSNVENPTGTIEGHGDVTVSVTIPVKKLDCGKRAMNKDMYNALKTDKFRYIKYHLLEASLINESSRTDTTSWMDIKTIGLLEVAGVTDTTSIVVKGKLLGPDRFRVRGSKQINMLNYDVTPPKALLGLIKADKYLTVHFDVTVRLAD